MPDKRSFALFFIDYDYDSSMPEHLKANTFDELRQLLIELIPPLANVQMLFRYSSSSNIKRIHDGKLLNEKKSMHVFFVVYGATEEAIKNFNEYIMRRAWAIGQGYALINKGGAVEIRCLIDMKVASPERIIITAAPVVPLGYVKLQSERKLYDGGYLDLTQIDYESEPDYRPAFQAEKARLTSAPGYEQKRLLNMKNTVLKEVRGTGAVLPVTTTTLERLDAISKLLNSKKRVKVQEVRDLLDAEIVKAILIFIGYAIDANYKFKMRIENTPSASIRHDGYIKDFGSDFGGSIFDLFGKVWGMSFKKSMRYVYRCLGANMRQKESDYAPLRNPSEFQKMIRNNIKKAG